MEKIVFLNIHGGLVNRGVETFVFELASRLRKYFIIKVYQAGNINQQVSYDIKQIKINNFDHQSALANFLFSLKVIPEIIKEKPKIIYSLNGRWQTIIFRLISLFLKAKLVTGGHAGIGKDDLISLLVSPNVFICLSTKGKIWADRWAPWVKKTIIPHGVDIKKFNPKVKPFDLKLKHPIIMTVAGSEKFKQVDLTIKAVAGLKRASLLIMGQQSKETKNMAYKLLKSRFLITNYPHKLMPKVYNSIDLFTLVSNKREAFAVCYLEALSCGKGVVATDDDHRRQLIGQAGILIDSTNISDYTNALQKALTIDWQKKAVAQAKKFSWNKVAQKYSELFNSLVSK